MPAKIFITGNAGSGKTTTARRIGQVLNRQVISLDSIVWKPGWTKAAPDERRRAETNIISQDGWIVEGVSTLICEAADLVVFLDYPRRVCLFRCVKRNWRYLFKSRPELPDGCPEIRIIWRLLSIIRKFPSTVRPVILNQCNGRTGAVRFVHIRSNIELNHFLNEINSDHKTRA